MEHNCYRSSQAPDYISHRRMQNAARGQSALRCLAPMVLEWAGPGPPSKRHRQTECVTEKVNEDPGLTCKIRRVVYCTKAGCVYMVHIDLYIFFLTFFPSR